MLEEMAEFFESRLSGYDEHMRKDIEGAEEFYKKTAQLLPLEKNCAILDLGCGTGLELEEYFLRNPSAQVTAIDLSEGMLAALKKKFPDQAMNLICGSYFDVPFGENCFCAAVSVESLHHFAAAQKEALYQKLFAALKAGGFFILTDYFAESEALEREYFARLHRLKEAQGLPEQGLYHYDTPLTVEHEIEILRKAGFPEVEILGRWGATYALKATGKAKI